MKAHEEEWATDGYGLVASNNGSGPRVATIHAQTLEVERTRTLLVAAAPDMARALLLWIPYNGHTVECGNFTGNDEECSMECRTTRAALNKAGVLE